MKKLFCFIRKFSVITLVLIMTLAPLQTTAFGAQEDNITHINGYAKNPVYYDASEQSSSSQPSQAFEQEPTANTNELTEPALAVKNNMIARNECFTVKFTTTRTDFQALASEIFELAISEEFAQSAVEGDYLAWQYAGYSFTGSVSRIDTAYEYTFNFKVPYYTTAQQEQEVTTAVQNALDEMGIENLTNHDKCKAIYDFVCRVCNYDNSTIQNDYTKFSAYGAIIEGQAVCQGYSILLYRMLKEAGINNRIITSPNHIWNIVQLNGLYYNTDATWDDNYYDRGRDYQYFLTCDTHFEAHDREAQYCTEDFLNNYKMAQECYYDTYPEEFTSIETAAPQYETVIPAVQEEEAPPAVTVTPPVPVAQPTPTTVCTNHQYVLTNYAQNTCTADGYQYYRCSICGAEQTNILPSTGHRIVTDQAVSATYAREGLTQGSHCADCQLVIVPQYKVARLTVKATTIKKVNAKRKGFTVEWNKRANATGYEVQYSTANNFSAKTTKTATVTKNGTVSKKIADLKGNTKYFIRVRAYKVENGKKYYSSWTTVKNVKTKK